MLHRLMTLALAVTIGATPVAREICLIACTASDGAPADPAHAHHGAAQTMPLHDTSAHDMPAHDMTTHAMSAHDMASHEMAPTTAGHGMGTAVAHALSSGPRHGSHSERHHPGTMSSCESSIAVGRDGCAHPADWRAAPTVPPVTREIVSAPEWVVQLVDVPPPVMTLSSSPSSEPSLRPISVALRTPLRV